MRLFLAVNFDDEFKETLLRYRDELKAYADPYRKVNWSSPENLHLTLAFIGEYDRPEKIRPVLDNLRFGAFPIRTGRCGNFGSLWWVGLENGEQAVTLAENVRAGLRDAGIPFDPKPMKPHITVARELYPTRPPRLRIIPAETTVSRVSLMKSERIAGKLTYTELFGTDAETTEQ